MLDATTRNNRPEWLVVESWHRVGGVTVVTRHSTLASALRSLKHQQASMDRVRFEHPGDSMFIGATYIRQAATLD